VEPGSQNQIVRKIPVQALKYSLRTIFDAMREDGWTSEQVIDAFDSQLKASCPSCGLIFSGRELAQIGARQHLGYHQKLLSLTSGHCGLKDCSSPAYEIVYPETSSISWGDLLDSAQQSSEAPKKKEEEPARLEAAILEDPSRLLKGLIALILLLVALSLVYWTYRTPSWSSKPSPYQVAPRSMPSSDAAK
jgi:hypothetical protein